MLHVFSTNQSNLRYKNQKRQLFSDKESTMMHDFFYVLPPSQIVRRLTFLTSSLTTRLIQKIYVNIVKFKSFLKNFY